MKKANVIISILAGLGLTKPLQVNGDIVQPAKTTKLPIKEVKIHSEKLNKAEFNRARKAKKRIRDQQRSLANNPCIN